jgi:hypothetical protein
MSLFTKVSLEAWLRGLLAAVIGGGASGVTAGIGANFLAPDRFNFAGGSLATLKLMGLCFLLNAALNMFFFLRQSPIPKEEVKDAPPSA